MSLIAAAKYCKFCQKSWFSWKRIEYQTHVFEFLADAYYQADTSLGAEMITIDEYEQDVAFIRSLERECLLCNRNSSKIYRMVFDDEFASSSKKTENMKSKNDSDLGIDIKKRIN